MTLWSCVNRKNKIKEHVGICLTSLSSSTMFDYYFLWAFCEESSVFVCLVIWLLVQLSTIFH